MQILDKAITPDGIEIELHDLSGEHKLPDYNGMIIVFCTVAKNNFGHLFIVGENIQKI